MFRYSVNDIIKWTILKASVESQKISQKSGILKIGKSNWTTLNTITRHKIYKSELILPIYHEENIFN